MHPESTHLTIGWVRIALSIAGSDPTGGAGLQLDLQVFRTLGVHGAGVVTALTVQDTARVHQVLPVLASTVRDQLRTLLADVRPAALKLGMLATEAVLGAVVEGLGGLDVPRATRPPLVIDPVLRSTSGAILLERDAWSGLRALIGACDLVTPNLPEAQALTERDVSTRAGTEAAARHLVETLGARAALVTGGHAEGRPDDCLALGGKGGAHVRWLEGERIGGSPVHGTGCALSAAVTAELALGRGLEDAVHRARQFVRRALRGAVAPGHGARLLGFS